MLKKICFYRIPQTQIHYEDILMVRVDFLGPISKDSIHLEASTLDELSLKLSEDKSLQKWLSNSAVAINDELTNDKNHPLKNGDIISILPPVCGG